VSLGHRRQLLRAIAELKGGPERGTAAAVPATPHDTAERRQVTVMFSDLVGSTALSARMDPEDLREVISAYQKCVAETVRRFGGFVAKYMGRFAARVLAREAWKWPLLRYSLPAALGRHKVASVGFPRGRSFMGGSRFAARVLACEDSRRRRAGWQRSP
jgi:class 3 adenylate cyclase